MCVCVCVHVCACVGLITASLSSGRAGATDAAAASTSTRDFPFEGEDNRVASILQTGIGSVGMYISYIYLKKTFKFYPMFIIK